MKGIITLLMLAGCAVIVGACVMLIIVRRIQRGVERHKAGQCIECGYDLRESGDTCPECGAVRLDGSK